ncbi:hypothetical protein BaRGS_00033138 [Batillaria attramentaria]|uniref:Uncharacterized protein n=1 Tax=Batillaria attramentaria TaxID=370345 RepID=A0ABD0JLS3_9CAEN
MQTELTGHVTRLRSVRNWFLVCSKQGQIIIAGHTDGIKEPQKTRDTTKVKASEQNRALLCLVYTSVRVGRHGLD